MDANKSYYLLANIMYTAVANTGDLKLAFTVPAGTTFTGTSLIVAVGTSNAVIGSYQASGALITASTTAPGAGPIVVPVAYSGVLATSSTAGNLTFQWAQNTSNGTATVVKQGSHLFLRRVA